MLTVLLNTLRGQKGQGMVEYGLILGLVAVLVIGALSLMGGSVQNQFNQIAASL
jgi:pilus assembly protein Flp/PilA